MGLIKNVYLSLALAVCLSAPSISATPSAEVVTPQEYRRLPDQTFLTYPEWFLVFSPEEFATFIKDSPPNNFPFIGHIGQFWGSYWAIYQETKDKYAFNTGYHVMVMVIGTSTTIEYGLRSLYESLFGSLSYLTRTHGMTNEDKLAAQVAKDYVDFIKVTPWYEFDFSSALAKIWTETGYKGDDQIRKWERKYALTVEYGIKALYAKLIGVATKSVYDSPSLVTSIVLDKHSTALPETFDKLEVIKEERNGTELVLVPRYDQFKDYSSILANQNINFIEVAGNTSDILVSVLVPARWSLAATNTHTLFTQPILTLPGRKRIVFTTPVGNLARVIRSFKDQEIRLEHIYDF